MSGWLLLGVYAIVIAPTFAVVAWGVLQHSGHLSPRPAAASATFAWAVLVAVPLAGSVVDRARASSACTADHECYEHFFTVVGVPAGWLAAIALFAGALFIGRIQARHAS